MIAIHNNPYASLSLPANPVNEFCEVLKNTTDSVTDILMSLKKAMNIFPNYSPDECINFKEDESISTAWSYQLCTEMIPHVCADGIEDMFEPHPWDLEQYTKNYKDEFDVTVQLDFTCKIYGCLDFTAVSNIVFSNGLLDPWHTGGILKNVSESVIAVTIPEGAHQRDLAASHPDDPESVIRARKLHIHFISKWIREYRDKA